MEVSDVTVSLFNVRLRTHLHLCSYGRLGGTVLMEPGTVLTYTSSDHKQPTTGTVIRETSPGKWIVEDHYPTCSVKTRFVFESQLVYPLELPTNQSNQSIISVR